MKIAAILPHLSKFGGVRRFLEIGNAMIEKGHEYTIFARRDRSCRWFDYRGEIRGWKNIQADRILIGDPPCFEILPYVKGRIYVYVIAAGKYTPMYQEVYGKYPFILNNRKFKKDFPHSSLAEGGVNLHHFKPKSESNTSSDVRVLYIPGRKRQKGGSTIIHALRGIKGVTLVPLGGLGEEALAKAYRSGDFYVSWEGPGGWCNMAAEALASGLTVVTNGANCEPFIKRTIVVRDLRGFFSNPKNRQIRKSCSMKDFSWEAVSDKLLEIFAKSYSSARVHRAHARPAQAYPAQAPSAYVRPAHVHQPHVHKSHVDHHHHRR